MKTKFKRGDRVLPVNPETGKVHGSVGGVVRKVTTQTSMPLNFVRWDDETDADPLVWFRDNELTPEVKP